MSRKLSLLLGVLLLIVPLVVTACGGDDDDKKDDGGSDAVELNQTLNAEAAGLTVKYPDGWAARDEDGMVTVANSEVALSQQDSIEAGQFGLVIFPVPAAMLGENTSLEDGFGMFAGSMAEESETVTTGEVESIKVGGTDALRMDISDSGDNSEGFFVGYMVDDTLIIIAAVAPQGELADHEATALAIAASIDVSAPAE